MFKDDVTCLARFPKRRLQLPRRADLPKLQRPGTTRAAETTIGAEEDGGAVRIDEDGGAPTVGGRNEGVDEVDGDAAKPKEVTPRREEVRSDDGGEAELGGDGGERVQRREHESDGKSERRVAETEE
jgi:hypothetical protein